MIQTKHSVISVILLLSLCALASGDKWNNFTRDVTIEPKKYHHIAFDKKATSIQYTVSCNPAGDIFFLHETEFEKFTKNEPYSSIHVRFGEQKDSVSWTEKSDISKGLIVMVQNPSEKKMKSHFEISQLMPLIPPIVPPETEPLLWLLWIVIPTALACAFLPVIGIIACSKYAERRKEGYHEIKEGEKPEARIRQVREPTAVGASPSGSK